MSDVDCLIFGCGYLGRRVANCWSTQGHSVAAVTRSEAKANALHSEGIAPFLADILDLDSLRKLPSAKTILYAVAPDASLDRPREEVVLEGLRNVFQTIRGVDDSMVGQQVTRQRFLFISSTSVYGQSLGEWVDEESDCEPNSAAGKLARAAEQLARQHAATSILRLSGIYGPGRVLARIESLRSGIPFPGTPDAWLNLIHVDDAVTAIVRHADHPDPLPTLLVSDDRPCTRGAYYSLLAELAGTKQPEFDPALVAARGSGGLNKRCRNEALRRHYGLTMRYPDYRNGLTAILANRDELN